MTLEAFQCDVCFELITRNDVKVHLQKHQAQMLSLMSRLPNIASPDSPQTDEERVNGSQSPYRNNKRRSNPENKPGKTRRVQNTRSKLYQCSKCTHQSKRPHDYTRHYARHHDCNATCPQCNEFYAKTNEFLNKKHGCFQNPTPKLVELWDSVMKDVETEAGVSFKFRRQRHSFRPEPERPTIEATIQGSATELGIPLSEPDIGEMMESFIYEPQMEEFWNGPFAIAHSSL
ncbi:hypothetical protein DER44DRAFT_436092 [Fusarium oxysporum]|nr:hypothetical protein DER44DRAFT_436092 [Fusarium oxysporum]